MNYSAKTERIITRVSEHVKDTLMTAANIAGATLNQFLIQAALEKVESIIEKDKVICLSRKDSQVFFEALDNPPKPNKKLRKSVDNYKKLLAST